MNHQSNLYWKVSERRAHRFLGKPPYEKKPGWYWGRLSTKMWKADRISGAAHNRLMEKNWAVE